MIKIKKILPVLLASSLVVPSFLVTAESNESKTTEDFIQDNAIISSKDEVVYATLSASGDQQELYIVNNFDVEKAGKIVDYGTYSNVFNLTNLEKIEQVDQTVKFTAPKGKFYYQGNMNNQPLPWDISISYFLDGKEITPEELVGKDGHVQIGIITSANEQINSSFFENYLLQISLTLDPITFSNIKTSGGMIANAGKNKQVTYTIMPEKEGKISLEADVINFEMKGINITGVPSSMSIDAPDIDEMTGDMNSLSNAISKVNDGVANLNQGVQDLNNGVSKLHDGSAHFKNGIARIDNSSSELVGASVLIDEALTSMIKGLEENQLDSSGILELQEGLTQISNGLNQTAAGLNQLRMNYTAAYQSLDEAIASIPAYEITDAQIQQLYLSGADQAVLDQLLETYSAARTANGTYSTVKEGFTTVGPSLTQASKSIIDTATNLTSMGNELSNSLASTDEANPIEQLQQGLAALSSNYKEFHGGLVEYTNGISQLANSYVELDGGIANLSSGTNELADGVSELYNGTDKLYKSTSDLPAQMKEEVDNMIAEFENSDFEPVSFVSSQNNEKMNTVQFVIKTESIEKVENELTEEQPEEEKGFWERLLGLFKRG